MKKLLSRYWNFRIEGIPKALGILISVILTYNFEKLSTFFWKYNLKECGVGVKIQKGIKLRFPCNVVIKNNVTIGRHCQFDSEFSNSTLLIKSNSQINKFCNIDFSGGLVIGENVLISENVTIYSHDHGYDPHSNPKKVKKIIGDNVWIGSHSIILPKVEIIASNSIIASGSIVTKNVPENSIIAGNPAKIIYTI